MQIDWKQYDLKGVYDELIGSGGRPRKVARTLSHHLRSLSDEELQARQKGGRYCD